MLLAFKHAVKSSRDMAGRLAALVAIAGAACGIYVGGVSAVDSTLQGRDDWFAAGHLADVELRFAPTDADRLPSFDLPGVAASRSRMVSQGTIETPGGSPIPQAAEPLSLQLLTPARGDAPINTLTVLEGETLAPDDDAGVLIDRNLAQGRKLAIGQQVTVDVAGHREKLTVRGIVRDAEYLLAPVNPALFVPSKNSIGIAFANAAAIRPGYGFTPANSLLIRAEPGADIEELRAAVLDHAREAGLTQGYTQTPDEQFSSLYLDKNLGMFRVGIPVIVVVSALAAVMVTLFLIARWIAGQRQSIGVLLTLGYRGRSVAAAYGCVIAVLALVAALAGLGLAAGLGTAFIATFANSVGLPIAPLHLTGSALALAGIGLVALFATAGLLAIGQITRMTPLDAMRATRGGARPPGWVSGWLGARLPTTWLRMAVRGTLRSRTVSALTALSLGLGFGITAAFFIAFTSVVGTATASVDENTWDLTIDLGTPMAARDFEAMARAAGANDVVAATRGAAEARAGSRHVNLYVGGLDPTKNWYPARMLSGRDIDAGQPDGIALEQSAADELGVQVGDSISLDSLGGSREARVIGTFTGGMPGEARATTALGQRVGALGEDYTGGMARVPAGQIEQVKQRLEAEANVSQVMTRGEVRSAILDVSDQLTQIIRLGTAINIGVALLFVAACLGYTVAQRRGDYQLLRLLGHRDRIIRATIVTETMLLGLLAAVLALPIGLVTARIVNARLSGVWFHIDTVISAADFAKVLGPGLVLLPLVALAMAGTVLREPLDAFLRSREVG